MPFLNVRVPVNCIAPFGEPTLEERLADAQRDWGHRHVHLVQEALVGEL